MRASGEGIGLGVSLGASAELEEDDACLGLAGPRLSWAVHSAVLAMAVPRLGLGVPID